MEGDKLNIKALIENRPGILFAEIGALIHDLGKLSEEFVEHTTEGNIFEHNLILGRDFFYGREEERLNLSDQELDEIIDQLNQMSKKEAGISDFYDFLTKKLQISKNKAKNFFKKVLQPKYSSKNFKDKIIGLENIYCKFDTESESINNLTLADILSKHHNEEKYRKDILSSKELEYIYLLQRGADGVDSGIDKMVAEIKEVKQRKDHTYIATAFGYEKKRIDLDRFKPLRNKYAQNLYEILCDLQKDQNNIQTWIEKRRELLEYTRYAFSEALGETRRPANDVTLWDHSFSVASLYKAALAGAVLKEWKNPEDVNWRLLSISFNGNKFCFNTPKMSDILGRKTLLNKMLNFIKDFFEVVIPIGNEIYRDEYGSVFLVPEEIDINNFYITADIWNEIKNFELKEFCVNYKGKWQNKKLCAIYNITPDEEISLKEFLQDLTAIFSEGLIVPEFKISNKPSRGALTLGDIIKDRTLSTQIDIDLLQEHWEYKRSGHERCRSCGLRPIPISHEKYENLKEKKWSSLNEKDKQALKAYERGLCDFCLRIAQNRVEEWWNNEKRSIENPETSSFLDTTIWIDEASDENNRVALIYISFDLLRWLNGDLVNIFFSKPFLLNEFKMFFSHEKINLQELDFDKFKFALTQALNSNDFSNIKIIRSLLGLGRSVNDSPQEIFGKLIERREPDWTQKYPFEQGVTSSSNEHKASVLLLSLTRKHPSFARIRRIWETVKNFNKEVIAETKDLLSTRKRIKFKIALNLPITHTYWFKLENDWHEFAVVEENNGVTITKINNIEAFKDKIENNSIEVYSEPNKKKIASIKVNNLEEIHYQPIIPLFIEPSVCLFFVPLNDAWDVINLIKEKYEVEFNKVQHLLSVRIGFVGFHKRTPLYAVLNAAEKMMKAKNSKPEIFTVVDSCSYPEHTSKEFAPKNYIVRFKNEEDKRFCYHFTARLGDPEKKDLYHPYFIVENASDGWKTCVDRNWVVVKHLSQLREGDKVSFYPSYFDFLWLDSNIRRHDVGIERKHWFFKGSSPKPYYLKDIENFKRLKKLLLEDLKLTASQILNAYETLMTKIKEWELDKATLPITDKTFEEFIESIILNIPFRLKKGDTTEKGKIKDEDFLFLKESILSGLFLDFVDMWHTVLKKKFQEREE